MIAQLSWLVFNRNSINGIEVGQRTQDEKNKFSENNWSWLLYTISKVTESPGVSLVIW